jgi:hypothetical protein
MPRNPVPIAERFWTKVDRRGDAECWMWIGATNRGAKMRGGPYGKLGDEWPSRKTVLAHRVSYEMAKGEIPAGHQVDHRCRNSLCVNPQHLEAVLPHLNNERSSSPTAANIAKTHCPQGHEYTVENTGYRKRDLYRYCRTCARLAQRARRERGLTYTQWLEEHRLMR